MKKVVLPAILAVLLVFTAVSGCNKDKDKNKPFIEIIGDNPLTWFQYIPYVDPGANAYDITESGDTIDITYRLEVRDNVDVDVAGTYTVEYNVSDDAGNRADTKVRTVKVILTK